MIPARARDPGFITNTLEDKPLPIYVKAKPSEIIFPIARPLRGD